MRHIAFPFLVVAALAIGCQSASVQSEPDEYWVTVGADTLVTIQSAVPDIETDDAASPNTSKDGVTLVKVKRTQIPELTRLMHDEFHRCGGYMVHSSYDDAVLALTSDAGEKAVSKALESYTIDNGAVVTTILGALDQSKIADTISALSSFPTRYYSTQSGIDAAHWIRDQWQALAQSRADVSVELFQHSNFSQPSVIMTIQGDALADEVVVIGGHLDSTAGFNPGSGSPAPGADDDASGIATVTEVARAALASNYKPQRTVKIMAYAAEEVGLRGSREIADSFAAQSIDVVGVMQLDMTNYNGSTEDIALIEDYTNTAQNEFVGDLIDTYTGLAWVYTSCGYACSDHASWTQAGYVTSMPFESRFGEHNQSIHTANDTLAASGGDAQHAVKFAQLATAFIGELAKGDLNGDDGGGEPPPPPPPGPTTENFAGSVAQGEEVAYGPFSVESGSNFQAILMGSGDADLHVHFGAEATQQTFTCRPYVGGSNETCDVDVPTDQTLAYIMVHGYTAASFELSVTFRPGTGEPPPPPPPTGETTDSFTDSVSRGQEAQFGPFSVTAESDFKAVISGDGDGDLYVRFGAPPTTSSYTCRPYKNGSAETCDLTVPTDQSVAYVMVRGYQSAAFELLVTYTPDPGGDELPPPGGGTTDITETVSGSVAQLGEDSYGPYTVVPGTDVSVVMSPDNGSAGDADLYVRFGQAPTSSAYDCRPYTAGSSETCSLVVPTDDTQLYILVRGYSAASYQAEVSYTTPE